MLETLRKIGEQLLEGKGVWAQLTAEPKHEPKKKSWVVPILFDCDAGEIKLLEDKKTIFEPGKSEIDYRYIKTGLWGPSGKKCCVSCEQKNFDMLKESLLGKANKKSGTFAEAYDGFYNEEKKTDFRAALDEINGLKEKSDDFDLSKFKQELNFSKNEEAVLYYALVKSPKLNANKPIALFELDGYEEFIIDRFASSNGTAGLDYLTGEQRDEVVEAKFSERYNLNKTFQTTTFNYATGLNKKHFKKNFQIDLSSLASMDKASKFILNRFQIRIAGLPHIIVPNYLHKDLSSLNIEDLELFINRSNELLFESYELERDIRRELPESELFWINYVAIESDGNSFKVINHIKDVNSKHLARVVNVFKETHGLFMPFIGIKYPFNLKSLYWIIPVREGSKEKKNEVLVLFKEILEQRKVSEKKIYEYFIRMILCHRYEQYRQYQYKNGPGSFDFAAKDAVFKYSALIYALKQLNLIDMEKTDEKIKKPDENANSDSAQRIREFFDRMEYSPQEQALFYLGRVLNSVAYAQYKKGHKNKPVLNKINYNGMDASAIERLDLALAEKSRQYNIHNYTEPYFSKFREQFKTDKWELSPQKNVFFLMAGYTFNIGMSNSNETSSDN